MNTGKGKILIVEDDADMAFILEQVLSSQGYEIRKCTKVDEIYKTYSEFRPNLMLMDRMLDGVDSISEMSRIRKENTSLPIIALTAMASEDDLLKGFENGATDYVKKPFSARELTARIAAHLNIVQPTVPDKSALSIGTITLDRNAICLNSEKGKHPISILEYNLAKTLMENKNKTCSIEMLKNDLWGDCGPGHNQCLRVYVSKLRNIFLEGKDIDLISIRGKGYMLRDLSE